jgi:DNA-binding response OmpR family regulator
MSPEPATPTDAQHDRVGTVDSVEQSRLLVIEDDTRIGSSLARALEGSGYAVTWAPTALDGINVFTQALTDNVPYRLVLLDLGLPDANGLDVCRTLVNADPLIPVVMLTARDDELDSVIGLDAGAVDYVTKPFSLSPLLARIRAQLRRTDHVDAADTSGKCSPVVVTIGALTIDRAARRVVRNEREIALRPKEFDLLTRLAIDVGSAVTRETLMDDMWDTEWFGSTKTLDFHIAALRAKLDPTNGPSIIYNHSRRRLPPRKLGPNQSYAAPRSHRNHDGHHDRGASLRRPTRIRSRTPSR